MKRFIFLYLFLPFLSFSQNSNLNSIKCVNNQVIYEKVFITDSLSSLKIQELLLNTIPKLSGIKGLSMGDKILTAKVVELKVDYKKYTDKLDWIQGVWLKHPFYADLSILWKDGKYKVTLTNMNFIAGERVALICNDFFLEKDDSGNQVIKSNQKFLDTILVMERYLDDYFNVSHQISEW